MARLFARCLLLPLAALSGCRAPAQPAAAPAKPVAVPLVAVVPARLEPAPVRVAPTRPSAPVLWPTTKLRNAEYVSVRDIAARFEFKAAWSKAETLMTLSDARGVRLTFESNQRDFYFDGLRIFLGEPVLFHKDSLWINLVDVIKSLAPLVRPADHLTQLPFGAPKIIVLDPGHGGTDPGKQNLRLRLDEKDMTLDVALRLKKLLEIRGYRVLMTRTNDTRFSNSPIIDLPLRAEVANKAGADLFLSIHFNAVDREPERVAGTETYVLTPQFQVSTQPEQDKKMIEERYPGNRQDMANALLGYNLHRQLIRDLKGSDRGFKRYRLAVLRTLNCPGALVEAAYLSNDTEARRVATPEFRQRIAEALAEGVQNYSVALESLQPKPAAPVTAPPPPSSHQP